MLDDKPVLKERLIAGGAFAGIALFAVVAIDVLVTGGLDFGPGQAPYDRELPSAEVRFADASQYGGDSYASPDWSGSLFLRPPDTTASQERLAGADDGTPPPDTLGGASGDELYDEIAALYAETADGFRDEAQYEDAPAIDADEPYAQEDEERAYPSDEDSEAMLGASGSESP